MAERASQADQGEGERPVQDKDANTASDQNEDTVTGGESPVIQSTEDPTQPEEESACPGCRSLGVLTLPCGHKLCPSCIELSQGELNQASCTICYGSQLMDSVLHTLLDALFQGLPRRQGVTLGAEEESIRRPEDGGKALAGYRVIESEELCAQHGERVTVFCLQEEEPLCRQCQTDEHDEHQCCSIEEAVRNCKVRHKNQETEIGHKRDPPKIIGLCCTNEC